MTVDDRDQAILEAGFELARKLPRDATLRKRFKDSGWKSGDHVVIALDDERVVDVVARMLTHDTGGHAHIVIPHASAANGFRILVARVAVDADDHPHPTKTIELAHGASIGMLYSALHPCGTYMPSEWNKEMLFERCEA